MDEGEFIMPVHPEGAALQFFVEAMKANTATLQGVQAEQKETLRIVQDTREKIIKLESKAYDEVLTDIREYQKTQFAMLDDRVETLERAQLVTDTRASTWTYLIKNSPQIVALLGGTFLIIWLVLGKMGKI